MRFHICVGFIAFAADTSLSAQTAPAADPNIPKLNGQNLTFNPGKLADGTDTTWTFKTATDNAVATLAVSSEGTTVGATPKGFAQVLVNAQDEVPQPTGPPIGMNMNGGTFYNMTCDPAK